MGDACRSLRVKQEVTEQEIIIFILSKIQILIVCLSIFLNHIRYTLSEGTLSNISDFTIEDLSYGQFVFKPGEVAKSLSVNIVNDTLPEVNETLILNLTSRDGITSVTEESVQIFILDNGEYSQVRKSGQKNTVDCNVGNRTT